MIYSSEETREIFHKSPTLLQMVCGIFESISLSFRIEPELVVSDDNLAAIMIPGLTPDRYIDICTKMNNQFKRKDNEFTCILIDEENGLFEIYVTASKDFISFH